MSDASEFKTIQQFLETVNPKDEAVQKALGLSERAMQLFWAGLNAAGEDLVIANFMKTGKKVMPFPSPYINKLKKAKLVVHGKSHGSWNISAGAVKKLGAILKGEAVSADPVEVEKVSAGTRGSRRKKADKSRPESAATAAVKVPKKIANTTVGELIGTLQEEVATIDATTAELAVRREGLVKRIKGILALFE